mgnify:FL=1
MFKNVLIIGCGLIGSSLLRGIVNKKLTKHIYIFEKSKKNRLITKRLFKKVKFLKNLDNKISNMDLIILATPMSQYKNILKNVSKYMTDKNIITDVGSTKNNVENLIKNNSILDSNFILSHPIAGSEVSGPEFGNSKLFENKWCVIIKNKNKRKLRLIMKFWKKLGSRTVLMKTREHDNIFSITSHLPHLVAYNLIKTALNFQQKNKNNIIKFSAGGLRDFSRTAASNEIMWRDIFFSNDRNIIDSIDMFIKNLKDFKKKIQNKNNKEILKILKNSKIVRKQIIFMKQDVAKPNFGRDDS